MPTYDYRCDACGHEFELFQQMSAPVKKKCPECSKLKLKRLIGTGSGVMFKGSGFYETDYRSDSYKKAAKADRESSKPKEKKPEAKKKSETNKSSSHEKKE
jgi:putative FmdB family regulatory protein